MSLLALIGLVLATHVPSSVTEYCGVKNSNPVVLRSVAHIGIPAACFLRADPGPCARDLIRIYFDFKTYTCRAFSYSGCGGNANRFVSVKNCYKLCHPYYRQRFITFDPDPSGNDTARAMGGDQQPRSGGAGGNETAGMDIQDDDNATHVVPKNAPIFNSTEEPAEVQVVHEYDIYQPGQMGAPPGSGGRGGGAYPSPFIYPNPNNPSPGQSCSQGMPSYRNPNYPNPYGQYNIFYGRK